MASTVLLDEGNTALVNAKGNNTLVKLDSWKIGDFAGFSLDRTANDVLGNVVATGSNAEISVTIVSSDTLRFMLTLDEDAGNYNVGNIMLFDDGGNAIMWMVLESSVSKEANNLPAQVGNRLAFNMSLTYNNVSNLINTSILQQNLANIPIVSDDGSLPIASGAAYDLYLLQNHRNLASPTLAFRRNSDDKWFGLPYVDYINDAEFGILDGGVDGTGSVRNQDYVRAGGYLHDQQFTDTIDGGDLIENRTSTLDFGTI